MIWRLCAIGLVMLAVAVLPGCKKAPKATESTEPTEVKITKDNLNTELDKMQKEIDADVAAEEE